MLIVLILVVIVIITLISIILVYSYQTPKKNIPGKNPNDKENGNLGDITSAGGLNPFLLELHNEYGDICSFWINKTLIVSVCSAKLFKECSSLFDRPTIMFELFMPLLTKNSIQYGIGDDAKFRHNIYMKSLSNRKSMDRYCDIIKSECMILIENLKKIPKDEHISIIKHCLGLTTSIIMKILFNLDKTQEEAVKFVEDYMVVFESLEESLAPGHVFTDIDNRKESMINCVNKCLENCDDSDIFVGILNDNIKDIDVKRADAITFLIGGLHTTGYGIVWALFYILSHPEVEEKLRQEIDSMDDDDDLTMQNLPNFKYTKQVVQETLRLSRLSGWSARFSEYEMQLNGYTIPPNTPILQAFGVGFSNAAIWPNPDTFEPQRFAGEQLRQYQFEPFGFAGNRRCPASKLAFTEMTLALILLFKHLKFHLLPGQSFEEVGTKPMALVTKPGKEIWLTCEARS